MRKALRECKEDDWVLRPGDDAFYGLKIDFTVNDGMDGEFQCATIQLGFLLPRNFNLLYRTSDAADEQVQSESQTGSIVPAGMSWPVMIHLLLLTLSSVSLAS